VTISDLLRWMSGQPHCDGEPVVEVDHVTEVAAVRHRHDQVAGQIAVIEAGARAVRAAESGRDKERFGE